MRFHTDFNVDFKILDANVSKLKNIAPKNNILFMVKANAYGHGLVPVVKFAVENLGITEFGCATSGEAKILRQALPKHKFEIYVFSDVQIEFKNCSELYLNQRILPVLCSIEDLTYVLHNNDFRHFPLCLKFNTGMNRLGIEVKDQQKVVDLLKKYNRKEIYHLFSHFSSTLLSVKKQRSQLQYSRFIELKNNFKASGIEIQYSSMANSGAIEQEFALEETHIRPGLMLYGPSSLLDQSIVENPWNAQLVGYLKTYVLQTFEVTRGTPIGYGGTPAYDDGIVALLAIGYGDGIPTYFQGAHLKHYNFEGRVLGRVNMDMMQLFFPKSQKCTIKSGDSFCLWNHDPAIFRELCKQLNVIPYELMCQLMTRISRTYHY